MNYSEDLIKFEPSSQNTITERSYSQFTSVIQFIPLS
jgi:hypothetical protein